MRKIVLFFTVFVIIIAVFLFQGKNQTKDTINYSNPPPWPLFIGIQYLLRASQAITDTFTPPAIKILSAGLQINRVNTIYTCAKLEIPEILENGPKSGAEIAKITGMSNKMTRRLMRACVALGVFRDVLVTKNDETRTYENTELGDNLRATHPFSVKPMLSSSVEDTQHGWVQFSKHMKDDNSIPFAAAFGYPHSPKSIWQYFDDNPIQREQFDKAMTSMDAIGNGALQEDFEWSKKCNTIVDVGGGRGSLLALLLKVAPNAKGVLFDLPVAIEHAKGYWQSNQDYSHLNSRVEFVQGNFLNQDESGLPKFVETNSCYITKTVLHDWDDEHTLQILKTITRVMKKGDRFIVIETIQMEPETDPLRPLVDLHMRVIGGQERTPEEFEILYNQVGLRIVEIHPTRSLYMIVEAIKE
eukprot:c16312_g1_i1.p1 GENE.c16312_g1_i1~~c16312_g1_i1.p1  ORF type:complete len:414 (+),score=119.24 c16312_g1_i1:75-1316(+)